MTNGRKFGKQIDDAVASLESDLSLSTKQNDKLNKELTLNRGKVAAALAAIARVQVNAIELKEIEATDSMTRDAFKVIGDRETRRNLLNTQLSESRAQLQVREKSARGTGEKRDHAAAEVAEIHALAGAKLSQDAGHLELVTIAEQSQATAEAAAAKAIAAGEERDQKAGAYEGDPIFMYLHKRNYGGASYRAGRLVMMVDGWLAALCGFVKAAEDYETLTALPSYMDKHAASMKSAAAAAAKKVDLSTRDALVRDGIEVREAVLAEMEKELRSADAAVDFTKSSIQDTLSAIRDMEQWVDPAGSRLLERMARAFDSASIDRMRDLVADTPSAEDDQLLATVEMARSSIADIERQLLEVTDEIARKKKRLRELQSVQSKYKSKYNSSDYSIRGSSSSDLLTGVIAGTVLADDLWRGIQKSASYSPPETSHSSSDSSSFSSGFSSGGGFGGGGGGGFSTGGGF